MEGNIRKITGRGRATGRVGYRTGRCLKLISMTRNNFCIYKYPLSLFFSTIQNVRDTYIR
jgi:hypothetical protein